MDYKYQGVVFDVCCRQLESLQIRIDESLEAQGQFTYRIEYADSDGVVHPKVSEIYKCITHVMHQVPNLKRFCFKGVKSSMVLGIKETKEGMSFLNALISFSKLRHLALISLPYRLSLDEIESLMPNLNYLHLEPCKVTTKVDVMANLLRRSSKLTYTRLIHGTDGMSRNLCVAIENTFKIHKAVNPDFDYYCTVRTYN